MPVAHIAVAHSASIFTALQQANEQQAQMSNLAQSQTRPEYASLLAQQNAFASAFGAGAWYHRQRATDMAKRGEKIIDRIAFWGEVPLIGGRIIGKLADRLTRLTFRIEAELERA